MGASRNKPLPDEPVLQAMSAGVSRYVCPGDTVTVAYSGGLDSTVLLHAAHAISERSGILLRAIHVNHGLSKNAESWAESCSRFCAGLQIPIAVVRVEVNVARGEGLEAAARRERHRALAAHKSEWIMLAHHADDQAETLLLNLLRGCGVRGAAAMPARRQRVLRPFLGLTRSTLLTYANSRSLQWIEDESNSDCRFTRNYLRAGILPTLGERFPKAAENLAAASARFGEASDLLDDLARIDLGGLATGFPLPTNLLCALSEPRARNLLRALLTWQGVQAPDERRMVEFVRQLRTAGSDKCPRLDLGTYSLWRASGMVLLRKPD